MERMKNNCTGMEAKLADMLLDPEAVPAKVRAHVAECDALPRGAGGAAGHDGPAGYLEGPEPSPYFLTRLDARMREERAGEPPAGWIARLRARFAYGPSMHVRPLAAMALSVMLLVGGGTYLGITNLRIRPRRRDKPPW